MFRSIAITLTVCLSTVNAHAALLGRAALTPGGTNYQAYYDDVQNITWVADGNLSYASEGDGLMTWADAQDWINQLNLGSYLGVGDWRLPATAQPDTTCDTLILAGQYGGLNCRGSEMGHLFYVDGISASSPGPFSNVQSYRYWSGTDYAPTSGSVWMFAFGGGVQEQDFKYLPVYAWAVRPGDIAVVPTPPAVWLFGSALGLMGVMRRKLTS